jgi:3-oxo-5alpha-steroid 4-dehydrogenase
MEASITRRQAVAGGAAALGVALMTGAKRAKAVSADEVSWDLEADVVVCGCGTGGAPAAVAAAQAGASVIVIEKKDWLGGQLRRCGGGVAAAGSQVQAALGVEDDPESFYEYWMAMQGDKCDADLVHDICENSSAYLDWIIDDLGGQPVDEWGFSEGGGDEGLTYSTEPGLNIGTQVENYESVGMEPVARCHWFSPNYDDPIIGDESKVVCPNPGGTGLWKVFSDAFDSYGVQALTETSLVRLVTVPSTNEVAGVIAEQDGAELAIKAARGVIIATGNFCSNHEMFYNYTGEDFTAVEGFGNGVGIDLPDDNDGVGIQAILSLGGELVFPANGLTDNGDGTYMAYSFMSSGVRIDRKARALDVYGEPIPRLYVTSNAAGGQIILSYHCCGVNVLRHGYTGRVAGADAATLEPWE